jgi:hypothetical protein
VKAAWNQLWEWAKKRLNERPFTRLAGHFVSRSFRGGAESDSDEMDFSTGLLLVLLPIPGTFVSIFFYDKYSTLLQFIRRDMVLDPYYASLGDEYLFVVVSMFVTGMIAVWRWDSILLDCRDFANLVHLPISAWRLFSANLVVILFLAALFAFEVNIGSSVLFPVVVSSSYPEFSAFLGFATGHAAGVTLASVFTFVSVVALIGLPMSLLPYRIFRRVSQYLRILLIVFFLFLLMTSFVISPLVRNLVQEPASIIRFLPSVWFVSLCEMIRHPALPVYQHLGRIGLLSLVAVAILAIVTYSLSFRRCFLSIPETVEATVPKSGALLPFLLRIADRFYLRTPARRAGFSFVMRTLTRSEKHFTALGAFVGMGLLLSAQTMLTATRDGLDVDSGQIPSPGQLSIPLILVYCLVVGLRIVFEIPAELRANWIFKLHLNPEVPESVALGRALVWTILTPFLLLVCFPAYVYGWGWLIATLHLIFLTAMSALLVETMMLRLGKIPFTCSLPLFKENAFVVVFLLILGFTFFVRAGAFLEYLVFLYPLRVILLVIVMGGWLWAIREQRSNQLEIDKALIFEESPVETVQVLGLDGKY